MRSKNFNIQKFLSKISCISKLLCNFATEMRIVSHRKLVEFYSSEGHGDAQAALERWYDTAERLRLTSLRLTMWVISIMCLISEETNTG